MLKFYRLRKVKPPFQRACLNFFSYFRVPSALQMATSQKLPPLSLPEELSSQSDMEASQNEDEAIALSCYGNSGSPLPSAVGLALNSPEGIMCYGNERCFLQEQAKFCNNEKLSDIILVVNGHKFFAHKMILVRGSDVFERMLSSDWADPSKQVKQYREMVMDVTLYLIIPNFK